MGPLICRISRRSGRLAPWIRRRRRRHVLGLIQYSLGGRYLGTAGELRPESQSPAARAGATRALVRALEAVVGLGLILWVLQAIGAVHLTLVGFVASAGVFIVSLAAAYLLYVVMFGGLTTAEKSASASSPCASRCGVFLVGVRAAGSSMNLFADRWDRSRLWRVGDAGKLAASVNGLFIIPARSAVQRALSLARAAIRQSPRKWASA